MTVDVGDKYVAVGVGYKVISYTFPLQPDRIARTIRTVYTYLIIFTPY